MGVGHTRDTCFKLNGPPNWFLELTATKGGNIGGNLAANVQAKGGGEYADNPLDGEENYPGMDPKPVNAVVQKMMKVMKGKSLRDEGGAACPMLPTIVQVQASDERVAQGRRKGNLYLFEYEHVFDECNNYINSVVIDVV
ncbi:uncharacterized protein LOC104896350 [Beta vulgaris subsp. vulgaris]|uniref:uncharacterized protein LOC104896350 n=1 Tax=Beta vulgaris subsp. vulgaris TaxID=3555 RepID=UPI00203672D6|nr:uncharacterized protein LOC104896350 [Beta vulgaris subsp. vulgaris]